MHTKTIAELSRALAQGEFSSQELTQTYLDRIERLDAEVNGYITVTREAALAAAKAADAVIKAGTAGPLTGIPIAQKDGKKSETNRKCRQKR